MQIRRGKVWEIWSCVVKSGRQKVDTRGAVPNCSNSCFVLPNPKQRTVPIAHLANVLSSSSDQMGISRKGFKFLHHASATTHVSTFCLPDITTRNQSYNQIPRPSLHSYIMLAIKDWRWERNYIIAINVVSCVIPQEVHRKL